jgi:ATP-dependent helicase HrpB
MLPIDEVLGELTAALRARTEAVLVAPPGAGKTTRVPLALMNEPWAMGGTLLMLAPRRIAARAAAARMAQALGEPIGQTIGYRVRLESRVSERTRVEVVTEGVFTRRILGDPALTGVCGVVLDEFHERSLEGDLALALARDCQLGLREDLRLLVMSATLDAASVAALLGDAPIIESKGRMFPVAVRHRPPAAPNADPAAEVAAAVRDAVRTEPGSVLAFLPGAGEIERCARALEGALPSGVALHTLYGALDPAAQDVAIRPAPAGARKVVLASAIAETSLTIEGVRVVVDAGLSRRPRFEPDVGVTRLETVRASQSSVEQRRGRAGRLEPGVCYRLWAEGETRARPAFDPPEMLNADLSNLALDLALWGVSDPMQLAWLDPPPKAAWTEAVKALRAFGALEADGRLTPDGRRMAELPLPPRLAHMVLRASAAERAGAALLAVAITEESLARGVTDARTRVEKLTRDGSPRAKAARGLAQRIARQAGGGQNPIDADDAGKWLALAFPERVAKARGPGAFQLANGRIVKLDPSDPLSASPYLAVGEITGAADKASVRLAAPLSAEELQALFAVQIEKRTEVRFEAGAGAVRGRRTTRYGRLILAEGPLEAIPKAEASAALLAAIQSEGLSLLPEEPALRMLQARVALLRRLEGEEAWPDFSDAALEARLSEWLAPLLDGVSRLDALAGRLAPSVEGLLDYAQRRRLADQAPLRFESPAGGDHAIDYTAANGPALSIRLQELFGLDAHPSVANGRAPLLLLLLSPAHRPVQTTRDLPGFWRGSYAAVRSDLRGRYPKHPWPDDPLAAAPTRRAKPKGS